MSDDEREYEVESVTRARVHDKRGKKLIWRYYVKWKGYGWDECTWEPVEHFTDGAEKIIDHFWECVNIGGRDIHDATAFKKGEEILVSGPPKKSGLKRKQSTSSVKQASPPKQRNTVSTPITTPRKRRKVQKPYDDVLENMRPRRQARTPRFQRKTSGRKSLQDTKRRRASSPGPRRIVSTNSPSSTDSELDAEGEVDPDFELETREVEDVLMQSSGEDGDERPQGEPLAKSAVETSPVFNDLEHFYSGQPIDVEQADPDEIDTSPSQRVASTATSPPDPLFDSPPSAVGSTRQRSLESSTPFHRARAANPLVKLIDAPPPQTSGKAITAKARLMSMPAMSSSSAGPTRVVAKRGGRPGPGRSSAGLLATNRSSLLTASKGKLTTVKGRFAPVNTTRDQPENSAEKAPKRGDGHPDTVVALLDDQDVVEMDGEGNALAPSTDPKPSGSDLLKLAGVSEDAAALPDFDEIDVSGVGSVNGSSNQLPSEVTKAEDQDEGVKVETQEASCVPTTESGPTNVSVLPEDIAKKNLAKVKELLFPSTQVIAPAFGEGSTSLRSTIFGPLYQGTTPNPPSHSAINEKEAPTSFKITVNDTLSIPITLRDATLVKDGMGDLRIGKSANGRAGNFYGQHDALAIVSALRSHGVARVAPDPSVDFQQQEQFTSILRQFESNRTFISAVGVDVFVLYSSENVAIAEKLSTPTHLIGLSSTLLVSRASIENFSAYARAAYAAQSTES